MKRRLVFLIGGLLSGVAVAAQDAGLPAIEKLEQRIAALDAEAAKPKKFKVSGYIQGQYQWGEANAALKVGSANEAAATPYNRIGVRRGRIKFAYEERIVSGVFQIDLTEKGVAFKDVYLHITDPWFRSVALRAGIFDRPFGYEISYSSSRRESPERSTVFQTLFPDERDLGAMLVWQAPKTSPWSVVKLEAGLFAGNGIKRETDNRKDFIGRLSAAKAMGRRVSLGVGASYYNGGVYQGTTEVYTMAGNGFVRSSDAANRGRFAKREYIGFDLQCTVTTPAGLTKLHGEYLFGQQPGTGQSTRSPNYSDLPANDIYLRPFSGGYVMLVQDLGPLPLSAVLKYDVYDPNTRVAGDDVGRNGTGSADLLQSTLGFGALWDIDSSLRLQAFYELNTHEKTPHLAGMDADIADNVFTLRLQYKF